MSTQQPPPPPLPKRKPKHIGCLPSFLIIGGFTFAIIVLPSWFGKTSSEREAPPAPRQVETRKAADLAKKEVEEAAPPETRALPVTRPLSVTPARSATRAPQHVEAHQSEIDQFLEVVTVVDRHTVIASLRSKPGGPPWRLTIIVNEQWDNLPRATRLDYARTFRGAWAGVWPPEPGGAKVSIDIVNGDGKTVGGGTRSEAAVWVD
ncbi:MAG: hypothetical protein EOP84_19925 [Verrucomicrobiaceae bacterium]|nr:MAG: hypothetical protein EOP84_19925 [Verrucomicrobiaceae bacterium]